MRTPLIIDKIDASELARFYRSELTENVLPFWLEHGLDHEHGGWLTCVDREGKLYSSDKSVWFQGRGTWTFAAAFRQIEANPKYLQAATTGYRFLKDKCFDKDGRMFFQLTREGLPLQKRRYWFSETFAVVAAAEFYRITGDLDALALARNTWELLLKLYTHPELSPSKYHPTTRPMKGLAGPMILTITAQVLRGADPENSGKYTENIAGFLQEIRRDFLKPKLKALLENVSPDGSLLPGPKGRLLNPGHAIEASWFLMAEAKHTGDAELFTEALKILEWSFEKGWDPEFGGLLSFVDLEGRPPEQLEWDMKLWWPHNEALIAFAMAWQATGEQKYHDGFVKVHNYSWSHFADSVHGDWYGYLHRDGSVANTLKGSLFKGPFHLPRCLMVLTTLFEELAQKSGGTQSNLSPNLKVEG
jgi:N-acylglucosamine 2-epimerase